MGSCQGCKAYTGMLLIGLINNLPYWVALSSAQQVCNHFGSPGLIGAVTWACVLLGMGATTTNAFLSSHNISYTMRSIFNGSFMLVGLIGVAFSVNIYMALAFMTLVGLSSDFGEGVMLGFFASRQSSSLMNAWGIGTGFSGFLGSAYAFLTQFFIIPFKWSFLAICPLGIIYPVCFVFLVGDATSWTAHDVDTDEEVQDDPSGDKLEEIEDPETGNVGLAETAANPIEPVSSTPQETSCCSARLWRKAFFYFINNGLTFFFQYASISGLTDCSITKSRKDKMPYLYSLLNLMYQIGQLGSRSTLQFFKFPRVVLLTCLQGAFFVLWMFNANFKFLPFWLEIITMIILGAVGGLSYVNIFDLCMNHPTATFKEREIMANITSVSIAGFIVVSSAFSLLIQNVLMKNQCLHS